LHEGVMVSPNPWLPGIDPMIGGFTLSIWAAGMLVAAIVLLAVLAFRRADRPGTSGLVWRGSLIAIGVLLAWIWISPAAVRDQVAARRALDARATELTARAMAPGSALACLDAVGNVTVEAACERVVFASPEAVAAAVAYVDARLALLADSLAYAGGDSSYGPALERLRRSVEADRFGVVAHVLTIRGCNVSDCAGLKLLRDPQRVLANLRGRTFDGMVARNSVAWRQDGLPPLPPVVSMPSPIAGSPSVAPTLSAATTGSASAANRWDSPSAGSAFGTASIEPPAPEPAAAATATPPSRAPLPSIRRQTTREPPPGGVPLAVAPFSQNPPLLPPPGTQLGAR